MQKHVSVAKGGVQLIGCFYLILMTIQMGKDATEGGKHNAKLSEKIAQSHNNKNNNSNDNRSATVINA